MSASAKEPLSQQEPDPLDTLLRLGRRARHAASAVELGFIAVNETYALAPYRQAALWVPERGVTSLSGVVTPEANAPFVHWLDRVASRLAQRGDKDATVVTSEMLADADAAEWEEWLPAQAVWLPFASGGDRDGPQQGGLLLARDEPWTAPEFSLLMEWLDTWQHAWQPFHRPTRSGSLLRWFQKPSSTDAKAPLGDRLRDASQRALRGVLSPSSWGDHLRTFGRWLTAQPAAIWRQPFKRYGMLALLCAFIPVRLSVLVPGELVAAQPAAIRAPLEGTIDRFFIKPNQVVQQYEVLFQLDLTSLTAKLAVAQQEFATAEAEYRQAAQQAVFDVRSKSQLASLQGRIGEREAEVEYLQQQLARAQVTAPRAGIVLMDDPAEWVGKPVVIGERVLTIADERDIEVEAWLAPGDAIDLADDAAVTLYLDAAPLQPVRATLRYVAHEAIARPDGSYAYRLRAIVKTQHPAVRVGLKGTARVVGERVPAIYWVMRRPMAALRPWLGL
jgi:multidrug efflux pump subunit AcrA (membrane-fusion protein)